MTETNEPFESEGYSTAINIQRKMFEVLKEYDETVITNFYEQDGNHIMQLTMFDDSGDRYGTEIAISKNPSDGELGLVGRQVQIAMRQVMEVLEE